MLKQVKNVMESIFYRFLNYLNFSAYKQVQLETSIVHPY